MNNQHTIRHTCIGLIDGLTIPLALAAGLSALVNNSFTVIIACLAATFAGSLTMLFGGYIEGRKYINTGRPWRAAITIGAGYLTGGLISVMPYFFLSAPIEALKWSVGITLLALLIAGYLESILNGSKGWKGALRVFLTGAVAAVAAYLVAKLFA